MTKQSVIEPNDRRHLDSPKYLPTDSTCDAEGEKSCRNSTGKNKHSGVKIDISQQICVSKKIKFSYWTE